MFYFVAGVAVSIIVFRFIFYKGSSFYNYSEKFLFGFLSLILSLMISGFISFVSFALVDAMSHSDYQKVQEEKIIALQDNGSVRGSFFLGSGNIDGSMSYVYMTEDNGMMHMSTLGADLVSLSYSEGQPKVERYRS